MGTTGIILTVFAAVAVVYFVIAYFCFRFTAKRGRPLDPEANLADAQFDGSREWVKEERAFLRSLPFETWEIVSHDGLKLRAKYYGAETPRAAVLLFHGYRSSGYNDFSVIVRRYLAAGYSVLIVDERAHGESEGKYIGFGVLERLDCVRWAREAAARFGCGMPLVIHGLSMGASTVLMASGEELPDSVRGIIADCGFTSPKAILSAVVRQRNRVPPFLIVPAAGVWFRLLAHYGIRECSTTEALKKNTRPVLLIHGEADDFVPYFMGVENRDAAGENAVFVSVPGALHGMSYLVDRERCEKELDAFFDRVLK